MNWKKRRIPAPGQSSPLWRLLILALFFLLGVVLGQVVLEWVPDETGTELKQYLEGYLSLRRRKRRRGRCPAGSTGAVHPLSAAGVFPGICVHRGGAAAPARRWPSGFSCRFLCAVLPLPLAVTAVVLALAVLGVRCAVTLPCFFLLADASMETSACAGPGILWEGTPYGARLFTAGAAGFVWALFWRR